jgi:hypothetical protein
MRTLICLCLSLVFATQISFTQKNRFRTTNDVVFGFYKPWDQEKLKSKIPAQLLHDDIDLFVHTIEDVGVNPYFNISKDSFYREIALLKRRIDKPLTRREFLQQVVPVVNELELSHTFINTDYGFNDKIYYDKSGGTYFPLDVRVEGDRLFIDKDYSPARLSDGDEIISINTIHSRIVIDSLSRYSIGSTRYSKLMDVQDNFSSLLWWVYDFSDSFRIETRKGVYSLDGLTSAELDKARSEYSNQPPKKEYKQYEYTQIDSLTAELIFRDFGIRDTASYNRFLDSAFLQLKINAIQNLIIDVRGHAGGGDQYGVEIVRYVYGKPFRAYSKHYNKKSKISEEFYLLYLYPEDRNDPEMRKAVSWNGPCEADHRYGEYYDCGVETNYPEADSIRFKGKVFVLTDHRVTSAGAVFVGIIKDYGVGRILGTETDQSASMDGQGCYFLLPHSNVMAMGATEYLIRPDGDPGTAKGILPDYEVTQSKEDTRRGVDTVIDFALRLIKIRN